MNTEQKVQENRDKDFFEDSLNVQDQGHLNQSLPLEALNSEYIDMVMAHTQCNRIDAMKALRNSEGDVVLAIMNLTQDPPNQQTENNVKTLNNDDLYKKSIPHDDQISANKNKKLEPSEYSGQELDSKGNPTEEVTEEWLTAEDIDMVMAQAQCSRVDAIKALRKSEGDLVSAILELTM